MPQCNGALGPSFQNCIFVGNKAVGAGGAIGGRSIGVRVVNCTFESNWTSGLQTLSLGGGGAIGVSGETQVVGCRFIGNKSLDDFPESVGNGGALDIDGKVADFSTGVRIVDCEFLDNEASGRGGGAYVGIASLIPGYIVNCVFAGNVCRGTTLGIGLGGGLYYNSGRLVNCTFVNNDAQDPDGNADGGGAMLTSSTGMPSTTVNNCIFRGNHAESTLFPTDWFVQQVARPPQSLQFCPQYCDIEGFPPPPQCPCQNGCSGVFDADPRFVDPDGLDDDPDTYRDNDYHLVICSPCVEVGNPDSGPFVIPLDDFDIDGLDGNNEPTPDLDLNKRVLDHNANGACVAVVDIGVDEVVPPECPWDCADGNGVVDTVDFLRLLQDWGMQCPAALCDQLAPPGIDTVDFLGLLSAWGNCPQCGKGAQAGAGAGEAGAPGSGLTLEEALWVMGFSGAEDYAAWLEQASDEEREASGLLLAELLGGSG